VSAPGSAELEPYLRRPLTPPAAGVLDEIARGPIDAADALPRAAIDRLLDPSPLPAENGWCVLPDGVAYVAARTAMPCVSAEMIDWWFDWHPDDPLRYRVWHPAAHVSNSVERPAVRGLKAHWGTVHHPVEDVGTGVVHARIAFVAPSAIGFSTDALADPRVATIVCGYAGDDRLRVRHTPMVHVFLNDERGVVLRSRFWLGAALRPYAPPLVAAPAAALIGNRFVRRWALPRGLPRALARHCAEEYANLAALLPELYARFGPASDTA
jgi:hypothetical protein